jgi:hypothetical protein
MPQHGTVPDFDSVTVWASTSQRTNHSADGADRESLFKFSDDAGNSTHTLNLEFLFGAPSAFRQRQFFGGIKKQKKLLRSTRRSLDLQFIKRLLKEPTEI